MTSDEALVERIKKGDWRAFDELYARYEAPLYGFCARLLASREDAEEVFHETLLRALKSNDVRFERGGFKAYAYQIARNLCSNRRRSADRARRLALAAPPPEPSPPADRALESSERLAALERAVRSLPPALLELYELRVSGLSYEEIADVLAIPLGTVKSKMFHLVRLLKEDVQVWSARESIEPATGPLQGPSTELATAPLRGPSTRR